MKKATIRRCKIFNCDRRHGHYCCTGCEYKRNCKGRCLNSPAKCGQSRPETWKEVAARKGVRIISGAFAKRLLSTGENGGPYEPIGKFIERDGDRFVGIDNSTGHAWVEDFKTFSGCMAWLIGEVSTEDIKEGSGSYEKPL